MFARTVLAACAALAAGSAEAVTLRWSAQLDQAQETTVTVPAPEASGMGRGRIDTATGLLSWKVTYGGLTDHAMMMHTHGPAAPGATAGVTVDIGAIGGLDSGAMGSTTITSAQVAELLGGLWYVNVHTMANLGGEIRGQIQTAPVPLPAALPLALAGAAALAGVATRRRRRAAG